MLIVTRSSTRDLSNNDPNLAAVPPLRKTASVTSTIRSVDMEKGRFEKGSDWTPSNHKDSPYFDDDAIIRAVHRQIRREGR